MSSVALSSRNFALTGQPAQVTDGTNLRWEIRGPWGEGSSIWTSGAHPARPINSTTTVNRHQQSPMADRVFFDSALEWDDRDGWLADDSDK